MYISINLELPENVRELIKQETIATATKALLEDKKELKQCIQDCVKGVLKANITEILQGKDYKNFLRDKIIKELGINDR